jgi:hypothetical protein
MRWPVSLMALGAAMAIGLGMLQGCALDTAELYYWTDFYRMRMNVQIESVETVPTTFPCGQEEHACGCTIPMVAIEGFEPTFRIIYSTDGYCRLTTNEKKLARHEVCHARMYGGTNPERDAKECMEWYER